MLTALKEMKLWLLAEHKTTVKNTSTVLLFICSKNYMQSQFP